jgi:hypothetical protein
MSMLQRWQEFTGQQAVLDGDGRSFDDVAAKRAEVTAAGPKPEPERQAQSPASAA